MKICPGDSAREIPRGGDRTSQVHLVIHTKSATDQPSVDNVLKTIFQAAM